MSRMASLNALGLAAAALSLPARADITSTFDTSLDGWTGAGGTVSFVASGGAPGGYLRQQDTLSTWMTVSAPAAFRGNLTSYLSGTVSFEAINLNGQVSNLASGTLFGTVTITGSAGSATRTLGGTGEPTPGGGWAHYSAVLAPALWRGDLVAALGNVTAMTVVLESNEEILELNGFDNFRLATAVPEPQAAALWVAGLMGLGAVGRARRGRLT